MSTSFLGVLRRVVQVWDTPIVSPTLSGAIRRAHRSTRILIAIIYVMHGKHPLRDPRVQAIPGASRPAR